MEDWQPIETAPPCMWVVGRNEAYYGVTEYPCIFDPDRGFWIGAVEFALLPGVLPTEWHHLSPRPTDNPESR